MDSICRRWGWLRRLMMSWSTTVCFIAEEEVERAGGQVRWAGGLSQADFTDQTSHFDVRKLRICTCGADLVDLHTRLSPGQENGPTSQKHSSVPLIGEALVGGAALVYFCHSGSDGSSAAALPSTWRTDDIITLCFLSEEAPRLHPGGPRGLQSCGCR